MNNRAQKNSYKIGNSSMRPNKFLTFIQFIKTRKMLFVPFLLALITTISVATMFLSFNQRPEISKLPTVYGLDSATSFNTTKALIEASVENLKGQSSVATQMSTFGLDNSGRVVYKLPPYNVSGKPFKILTDKGDGVAYTGDKRQSEENYAKLVFFFTANNFRKSEVLSGGSAHISETAKVPFLSYSIFESPEAVCSIWNADISSLQPETFLVSVGCAGVSDYMSTANEVEPFYNAYLNAVDAQENTLVFGVPTISSGKNGYKRATLYQAQSGFDNEGIAVIGQYYAAPGSKNWKYFSEVSLDSNESLSCTSYNTNELVEAFYGFDCFSENIGKESRVGSV
jgi:hypothetical protein